MLFPLITIYFRIVKKTVYTVLKVICRIGVPIYFKHFEVLGREKIPPGAPVIFAPNHQKAFMDAILVAIYSSKPIHFLTRADVFVPPYLWILDALNMMPVYRIRDGYNTLAKNEEIFRRCKNLLKERRRILVFPEGNQKEGHFLRPLTKGTSRLALQTQAELTDPVFIVPVGITYMDYYRPRRKAILHFGDPINVNDYMDRYNEYNPRGLMDLRDDMTSAIGKCMLIARKDERYLDRLEAFNPGNDHLDFHTLKKQIADLSFMKFRRKPLLAKLSLFFGLFNLPPIIVLRHLLTHNIRDPQFIGPLKFAVGMILLPAWWLTAGLFLFYVFSTLWATIILLFIILSIFIRQDLKNLAWQPDFPRQPDMVLKKR